MDYQGLKLRHEKKYYINQAGYHIIRNKLKYSMKTDAHTNDDGEYMIRSLYLDDITNSSFFDKQGGIYYRKKYRIRIYNGNKDNIKLEKKIKYDEYIGKISETISFETYEAIITNTNLEILLINSSDLLRELYIEIKSNCLKPKVMVDYDREVYVSDDISNVRITFDKNLRTTHTWTHDLFDFDSPVTYVLEPYHTIMEIKYDAFLPTYIKNMVQHTERDISSISKYVLCRQKQRIMRGIETI
jgi:hypothetical protein